MRNRITNWQFLKRMRGLKSGDYVRIWLKRDSKCLGYCNVILDKSEGMVKKIENKYSYVYVHIYSGKTDCKALILNLHSLRDIKDYTTLDSNLKIDLIMPVEKSLGSKKDVLVTYDK